VGEANNVAGGAITQRQKRMVYHRAHRDHRGKTRGSLCVLCALCGEIAFAGGLASRRQRRSYGWAQTQRGQRGGL